MLKLRFILAVVAFVSSAPTTHAVEFSKVQAAGKTVTVCQVDLRREQLRLFLRDEQGDVYRRFDPLAEALRRQGSTLSFAMNAGMFHPGQLPVGLFVADGQTLFPLNVARGEGNFFLQPNGVFLVTAKGANVVATTEYSRLVDPVLLATQSGPLLILHGKLHPAFNPASTSRLIRNGVGVDAAGTVFFALSEEPVSFYEFAVCFRDVLHCSDALFLDGSVSSLYAPVLGRNDFRMDLGPLIGVVE